MMMMMITNIKMFLVDLLHIISHMFFLNVCCLDSNGINDVYKSWRRLVFFFLSDIFYKAQKFVEHLSKNIFHHFQLIIACH